MPERETLSAETAAQIQRLYDQGAIMEAWRLAEAHGPLASWRGVRSRVWAGRLAANLGSLRLSKALHRRNFRLHPRQNGPRAYYTQAVLDSQGPLAARRLLNDCSSAGEAEDTDSRVYLLTLRAIVAATFRDFDTARHWLDNARQVSSADLWLSVCEAGLLEKQDRYLEALAAARRPLDANPNYRPALQQTAHLLQVLDRDGEALELLREADRRLQCGPITAQLAVLEIELEHYAEALAAFDRYLSLSPLADRKNIEWVNHNRLTAACRTGQWERARELCQKLLDARRGRPNKYLEDLLARLERRPPPNRRLRLPLNFVRQHHLTCAPATLACLSQFWGRPAAHLELAEAICYDGTPSHSERRWAETQGWVTREFTVTWETSAQLLDRGLPFTLTTSETTSGHLQAVAGYDELRQSLFLRDPFFYYFSEGLCPQFLERYAVYGPRGMVMVPPAEAGRLAEVDLPDAAFYDQLHQVYCLLDTHARAEAEALAERMLAEAPDHRLSRLAAWALASYDTNVPQVLRHVESLLGKFPQAGHLLLVKWSCLAMTAGREERLAFLEAVAAQPASDPVFLIKLAEELQPDAREQQRRAALIRRALRCRPADPEFLKAQADLLWDQREFEEAAEFYRLAACGADHNENFARAYFTALRPLRQTARGLDFLRQRFERLGRKSANPVMTLFEALAGLDRGAEGFAALEAASQKRPEDGALWLYYADALARFGQFAQAGEILRRAEGKARRADFLRTAARLAAYGADRRRALTLWQEVLGLEPLALDANREITSLLAEINGPAAARAFLDEVCARFPHNCGLLRWRIEFLRGEPATVVEPLLRQLLAVNAVDGWARRELALVLGQTGRFAEALAEAEQAVALEPQVSQSYSVRGEVLLLGGRRSAARDDLRQALRLSVDNGYALQKMAELSLTEDERRDTLNFIQAELKRQVIFGDALFNFLAVARGLLPPAAVLGQFQEALDARPDLWSAWAVMIMQLTDMNRLSEALSHALLACQRFPLVPRLWVEKARLHNMRNELSPAIAALQQALGLNPAYGFAARLLAEMHQKGGDLPAARRALEQCIVHAPMDPFNHVGLGEILWKLGEREAAVHSVTRGLRLEPGVDRGWDLLAEWAQPMNQPELAVGLARDLAERRPGEPRSWMVLADCLAARRDAEALAAAERAIELNSWNEAAYDLKARLLAADNRFEEALACCHPAGLEPQPVSLQLREAWIEAQRGRLPSAVARLKAALAQQPGHYGGWQLLAEWLGELGEFQPAAEAADQMSRLAPQSPIPLGFAGDLLSRQGNETAAQERFRRAFDLDPAYAYAGLRLFDLLLAKSHSPAVRAEAEEILRRLNEHCPDERVTARNIQWAARLNQADRALELFLEFGGQCAAQQGDSLLFALDAVLTVVDSRRLEREILALLRGPAVHPWLGAAYVRVRFQNQRFAPPAILADFDFSAPSSPARPEGLAVHLLSEYLDGLAGAFDQARARRDITREWSLRWHLARLLKRHRAPLRASDWLWGKVGYALTTFHNYRAARHWLADWAERGQAEPWMLYNYALACVIRRQTDPVLPVLRRALNLRQHETLFGSLAVLAAAEEGLAGNTETARTLLGAVSLNRLNAIDQSLWHLGQALLVGDVAPPPGQRPAARPIREAMAKASASQTICFQHALVRRLYWRCVNRLAARSRLRSLRLWGVLHYFGLA